MLKWIVIVVLLIVATLGVWVVLSTPQSPCSVRFSSLGNLPLEQYAGGVDEIVVVPCAGGVVRELRRNPLSRGVMAEWDSKTQIVLSPILIGDADVAVWSRDGETKFLVAADPLRRALLRIALPFMNASGARFESGVLTNADPQPMTARPSGALAEMTGEVFIIHMDDGGYPPGQRPALTALRFGPGTLDGTSRSQTIEPAAVAMTPLPLPIDAPLSVWTSECPRALQRMSILLGSSPCEFLRSGGGALTLYDIENRGFLPRPRGALLLPPSAGAAETGIPTLVTPSGVILADSAGTARIRAEAPSAPVKDLPPGLVWTARMNPEKLEKVLQNDAATLLMPKKLTRSLRRWSRLLAAADSVEAAAGRENGFEEVRVHIRARVDGASRGGAR